MYQGQEVGGGIQGSSGGPVWSEDRMHGGQGLEGEGSQILQRA